MDEDTWRTIALQHLSYQELVAEQHRLREVILGLHEGLEDTQKKLQHVIKEGNSLSAQIRYLQALIRRTDGLQKKISALIARKNTSEAYTRPHGDATHAMIEYELALIFQNLQSSANDPLEPP